MANVTKTYSAADVSVWFGTTLIDDFESVTVKKNTDKYTHKEGTAGRVVRNKSGSTLGQIAVKLNQAHEEQSNLSGYANGDDFIPILIIDNNGKSVHSMPEGSIMKVADAVYGKESDDLEWIAEGSLPLHLNGGNN